MKPDRPKHTDGQEKGNVGDDVPLVVGTDVGIGQQPGKIDDYSKDDGRQQDSGEIVDVDKPGFDSGCKCGNKGNADGGRSFALSF